MLIRITFLLCSISLVGGRVNADELARFSAIVDLGADRGQSFGSIFEGVFGKFSGELSPEVAP